MRNRINGLKSEVIGSQSVPTAIQSSRVDTYLKELNDLTAQMNTAITRTMPALYKSLNDNNIRPNFGEAIKPVTRQP